jgi:sulfonate transport system substrate-binding protein
MILPRLLPRFFAIMALSLFWRSADGAETLRVGYTNAEGAKIPMFVAKDQRIFDKHGLDVRLVRVSPGRLAVPKLLSGELQFFLGNSGPVIEAIAIEKAPLAIIASLGKERFAIYTTAAITRVEGLKGKRFGVSTPGASQDRIATRALKKLGFDPAKDLRMVATGLSGSVDRLKSLARGEIDAATASSDDQIELSRVESEKIRKLVDLSDLGILVSGADIAATRSYLKLQRGTARRFLQAIEEALELARQRPDVLSAAYEKYAVSSGAEALEAKVKAYYAGKPPEHPYPDKKAVLSELEELKEKKPDLNLDPLAYVDESFY